MSKPAVEVEAVDFSYGPKLPPVLRACTARVAEGEVLAILGPNGRGKTTLLKLLLGSLKPDAGRVLIRGSPQGRDHLAFVPQLFQVSFPYRVLDMVLMGRARHVGLFGQPAKADIETAQDALDRLGLTGLAERNFDELSGGQRQLVIFARALASGASILVLDEPTSALDLKNQSVVLEWIARLRAEGLTVLFTTHHPHHALAVADEALLMFGPGEQAVGTVAEVLTEDNLQRLYGVPLRRLDFEHRGQMLQALVPLLAGLQPAGHTGALKQRTFTNDF